MITEPELYAELRKILQLIGESVRHVWERYDSTGSPQYLSLLTDLDKAKSEIAKNLNQES